MSLVQVKHAAVPGRLRLSVPCLKRDSEYAGRLVELGKQWPGVRHASASAVTGTLLVEYDPRVASVDQIIARTRSALEEPSTARRYALAPAPVVRPSRTRLPAAHVGAAAATLLGSGALLTSLLLESEPLWIDRVLLETAENLHSPLLTAVMRGGSQLVEPWVLLPVTAVATAGGIGRRSSDAWPWRLPVTVGGGLSLVMLLKLLLRRTRPVIFDHLIDVGGYSLPSGHAFMAVSLYGALAYESYRWLRAHRPEEHGAAVALVATFVLLVLLIGVSRVYLGVHYPTDVIAGYALALLWLFALRTLESNSISSGKQGRAER